MFLLLALVMGMQAVLANEMAEGRVESGSAAAHIKEGYMISGHVIEATTEENIPFATVLIVGCMALILSAIGATPGAAERVMPLVFVLKEGKLFLLCSQRVCIFFQLVDFLPCYSRSGYCHGVRNRQHHGKGQNSRQQPAAPFFDRFSHACVSLSVR